MKEKKLRRSFLGNMDLSKALNIGTDYKDRRVTPNWEMRLFAEIVFIDKTHCSIKPLIYQVQDSAFQKDGGSLTSASSFNSFSHESFILLGEVAAIDKKKKQVLLSNKNIVSYNYLVIVTGAQSPFQHVEFSAGLQALIEALRVKPKIGDSFSLQSNTPSVNPPTHLTSAEMQEGNPVSHSEIEKIVHSFISSAQNDSFSMSFRTNHKRLYEIQL